MPPQANTERPSAKILKPSTEGNVYDGILVPLMFGMATRTRPTVLEFEVYLLLVTNAAQL